MPQTANGREPYTATTRAVIEQLLRTWPQPRVEETTEWFSEDAVYVLNLSEAVLPFSGETQGLIQIRNALTALRSGGSYLLFAPIIRDVSDEVGRVHVRFDYLDRPSGEVLSSTMRLVVTVSHRRIVRLEEFHDAPRVEAFFHYAAWKFRRHG